MEKICSFSLSDTSGENKVKLRVGQVGLGHLGKLRCAALAQMPEVDLVGVYDIDADRSREIAGTHHLQNFSNLTDLLANVEALVVAVPTRQHFEIVTTAISGGIHVFVEKPIAASVAEANVLVEKARRKNLVLQVGHIERFNPAVRALAAEAVAPRFIDSQRLSPFNGRGTDVAVVLDLMVHDLDLILHFVKSKVRKIDGYGLAVITPELDIANARLEFENGCVANLTASRISSQKLRMMNLFQKDAYFCIDFLRGVTEKFSLAGPIPDKSVGQTSVRSFPQKAVLCNQTGGTNNDALQLELKSFVNCVIQKRAPVVDGVVAAGVLELAFEIITTIEKSS